MESSKVDELREFLVRRLEQCGWKDEIYAMAKGIVRRCDGKITSAELCDVLAPAGRELIPGSVKREICMLVKEELMKN